MILRRSLVGLLLVGLAAGAASVPASAEAAGTTEVSVVGGLVRFASATRASVEVRYVCGDGAGASSVEDLAVDVHQQWTFRATAQGSGSVTCDGTERTRTIALERATGEAFLDGSAEADILLGAGPSKKVVVEVVGAPAPEPIPVVTTIFGIADNLVMFDAYGSSTVDVIFECSNADGQETVEELGVVVQQSVGARQTGSATGTGRGFCSAMRSLSPVEVTMVDGELFNGTARATVTLRGVTQVMDVRVAGRRDRPETTPSVRLTTDATPEPARQGRKITVRGKIRAASAAVKRAETILEFSPDGGVYTKVATVRSDRQGKLSARVEADRSGTYRFRFEGSDKLAAGTSAGDHVKVLPPVRSYRSCASLTAVYPHGVARRGAKDKGGNRTDFTVDSRTYAKNKKRDGDKDGIACER